MLKLRRISWREALTLLWNALMGRIPRRTKWKRQQTQRVVGNGTYLSRREILDVVCLMALKKVRSSDRDQTPASPNYSRSQKSQRFKMFRTQMLPFATPLRTTNLCHQYGEVPITASPYRHKSLSAKHYSWCQKLSDGPINKNKNLILVIPQLLPTLPLSDGQDLGNALISPFTTFKKKIFCQKNLSLEFTRPRFLPWREVTDHNFGTPKSLKII